MRTETLAEGVVLHLGDMREVLPGLGSGFAVLTDPPYGINIGGAKAIGGAGIVHPKEYGKHDWDKVGLSHQQWNLITAAADEWIVWGGNHLADVLGKSPGVLVWDKKCQNGWDDTFSDAEIAWTNSLTRAKAFRHMWVGAFRDSERGANIRERPTQKPIALMQWCLGFLTPGKCVLDPFLGSGTSGVAAVKQGARFVGVEISPAYFDVACRRISDALARPDLFIEPPKPIKQEAMTW
jgi:DNA modification methylase